MSKLHHVAIATTEFERYKKIFEQLGMTVERENGQIPTRQLWFYEGIQLKEVDDIQLGTNVDHIAIETNNIEETIKIALLNGCKMDTYRENWFVLPNGTKIELMK